MGCRLFGVYRKENGQKYWQKDEERTKFLRHSRSIKRVNCDRTKATKNEVRGKRPLFFSFKNPSIKGRSVRKTENGMPNRPQKKVQTVKSLASKFKFCVVTPKTEGGHAMQELTKK